MFYSNKESNTPWRNHLNRSYYGYGYEATTLQNQGWDIPSADDLELDDQFILELALPGVVLDDIEVKVEENFLTVTAKRTPVMFQDRATYLRKELPIIHKNNIRLLVIGREDQLPAAVRKDIDAAMEGNICRCGTYVRIKQAIKTASKL